MKKCIVVTVMVLLLVLCVAGCSTGSKPSETPEKDQGTAVGEGPYKDGDVIRLVVPWSAGGGFDRVARLVQPYFEAELEKLTGADVTVVVENVTGAGGAIGLREFYRAAPDGKTIGTVSFGGGAYLQLATGEFDMTKYSYIGILNKDVNIIVVQPKCPYTSVKELIEASKNKSTLFATDGAGASGHLDNLIMRAVLASKGIDWKMDFVRRIIRCHARVGER
ncbi:MAG TPA: hypothetical protein GX507_06655 [Clostridia bacterium]|nr:hypothetical protein [Clostridia bacterium]